MIDHRKRVRIPHFLHPTDWTMKKQKTKPRGLSLQTRLTETIWIGDVAINFIKSQKHPTMPRIVIDAPVDVEIVRAK